MPFTDSARKQFPSIVPTNPTTPTIPIHLQGIVDAVEARVVLRAADWGYANTFLAPFQDGMMIYIEDIDELHLRVAGVFKKIYPTNYTGTGVPASALGADGDLYFQTA